MHRLSILALFALSLSPLTALAAPQGQVAIVDQPVHTTESWKWTDCGLPEDIIQLESVEVSPDPPQPGKDLTVTVKGRVQETIQEGAYADVTVKLGVIKLLQKQFDVCEEARNANATIQCPVSEGAYTVSHSVALPKEIPKAKFVVLVRAFSVDENPMACVNIEVNFMRRPFPKLW